MNADGLIGISAALRPPFSDNNDRKNLGISGCGMAILAGFGRVPTSREVPCSIRDKQSDPSADRNVRSLHSPALIQNGHDSLESGSVDINSNCRRADLEKTKSRAVECTGRTSFFAISSVTNPTPDCSRYASGGISPVDTCPVSKSMANSSRRASIPGGSGAAQTQRSRFMSQSSRSARFLAKQREYIASRPGGSLSTASSTSNGERHSSNMI